MKLIAAVDNNWGIGCDGKLLVQIPADQKFFRNETIGKVIVMGRKTLDSFPQGQPLPQRTNIVLTRRTDLDTRGVIVVRSMDEALEKLKEYDTDDVYIVGGDTIYGQFIDLCDEALITKIDHTYRADAFFPNLDERDDWVITHDSEEQTYFDLEYRFLKYSRIKKG